ncbi:MAG: GNAT family N-acetyltransferase, partial [Chitinophagales bacterium]
ILQENNPDIWRFQTENSCHKRQGIGTKLIQKVLTKFSSIRQKVLLTDDREETRMFYESLGFESCDKGVLVAFTKLENKK